MVGYKGVGGGRDMSAFQWERSVSLGKYRRKGPLMFVALCRGLLGSAK